MGGQRKRKLGARPYKNFTDDQLQCALNAVQSGMMSEREAELEFGVPKSTINRKKNFKNILPVGRPSVFNLETEKALVTAAKWGFPLTSFDVRLIAKNYLDKIGCVEKRFKNNMPGLDWCKSFLRRHNDVLTVRITENIKRARASISIESITEYFSELSKTLEGIPANCILNYDETNLTDDPGRSKVICRRGSKHIERIIDSSKTSTSVMFSGTASGEMLPIYVVYKSQHLYSSWTNNAPKNTRFNRSKSGWFDMELYEDWFFEIVLPYFNKIGPQKKVMIGDNLASHVSEAVIRSCKENNIEFVLLPPNSTHLTQPLDVAFFRPLKQKWREVLLSWKSKHTGVLPKMHFPGMLKRVIKELEPKLSENLISGFRACGIYPLDPYQVTKRIPSTNTSTTSNDSAWLNSFEEFLNKRRTRDTPTKEVKRKKLNIAPGKSITETNPEVVLNTLNSKETPIVITLPAPNPAEMPSCSYEVQKMSTFNIDSDSDLDDIDGFQKSLKINDFVLVKCLYDANSKKENFKMFPCVIKNIRKSVYGIVFTCQFMRSYNGSTTIFTFPVIEDIAEVSEQNIVLRLRLIQERRGRYEFDL